MARLTIAQSRQKEILTLSEYIHEENANEKAKYIMNSFYRLAALYQRNFYDSQNSHICENARLYSLLQESEKKVDKWVLRLNKILLAYGLKIDFPGLYPHICKFENGKNGAVIVSGFWYN